MADKATVAANVRAELARHNKQRQSVADLLGLSRMAIHRRLTGETPFRVDELSKIAEDIGVSVTALIGEEKASA
jgi:transcriptional regulator with XRE-family HTH domain